LVRAKETQGKCKGAGQTTIFTIAKRGQKLAVYNGYRPGLVLQKPREYQGTDPIYFVIRFIIARNQECTMPTISMFYGILD